MPKIVRFHELGDASVLRVEDLPLEEPGPGEVRLKVEAIGLNRAEVLFHMGKYLVQPKLPSKIGYDAAGVIDAVGKGVTSVRVGDRVNTIPSFSAAAYGVYGEMAIVPDHAVTPYPPNLTAAEATTAGVQFMTVYCGLVELGKLEAGQTALITAGSSSTGVAAIQLAKAVGATAIATTRTAAKKQALLDVGADHVVVTGDEDLAETVKGIAGKAGVQVIFDPVAGGMMEAFSEVVAPLGHIVIYGLLNAKPMTLSPLSLLFKSFSVHGLQVFNFTGSDDYAPQPEAVERAKRFIYKHLESSAIKPVLAKRFKLDDIVASHEYMLSNEQIGKIIVEP